MSGEYQLVPARHGTATFVPRGHTIMIRNTYGKQVIDTWAFALNAPPKKKAQEKKTKDQAKKDESGDGDNKQEKEASSKEAEAKENKNGGEVNTEIEPESKDESNKQENKKDDNKENVDDSANSSPEKAKGDKTGKNTWSSYLPTLRSRAGPKNTKDKEDDDEKTKQANTRKWSSYLPSGKGYTSYLPSSEAISAFASSHYRDPEKSIAEQLQDFSKTPVGAAGLSGTHTEFET
jgi:hypothetical protein